MKKIIKKHTVLAVFCLCFGIMTLAHGADKATCTAKQSGGKLNIAKDGTASSARAEFLHFYADFNGNPEAVVDGLKTVNPINKEKYEYEDGPVGKAIIIDKAALKYKEDNNFPLKEGSIAFWMKPYWEPEKRKNHWVLQKWSGWKRGPVDGLWFLFGGNKLFASLNKESGITATSNWFYNQEWQVGQWRHLALVWGKQGTRYYINGCLVDSSCNTQCFPQKHAGKFSLGGKHNYYAGKMSMDDFRIYKNSISPKQVKELFLMGNPKFISPLPTVYRNKWNISKPPVKFGHLKKESFSTWTADSLRNFSAGNKVINDNETESGIACRAELTDKNITSLNSNALKWSLHTYGKNVKENIKQPITSLKIKDIVSGKGYHWYKLGTYTIGKNNLLWLYGINIAVDLGEVCSEKATASKFEIWARIKFEGPYFKNRTNKKKNAISLEWVVAKKKK